MNREYQAIKAALEAATEIAIDPGGPLGSEDTRLMARALASFFLTLPRNFTIPDGEHRSYSAHPDAWGAFARAVEKAVESEEG